MAHTSHEAPDGVSSSKKLGFTYRVEAYNKDGVLVDSEVQFNRMPLEILDYTMNAAYKQGPQFGQWYVGLFKGNYTPTGDEKMLTLPAAAQEFTGYNGSLRPAAVFGSVTNGRLDNTASPIELTFTQDEEVLGGFLTNGSGKGSTAGLCASIVRFSSPKRPGVGGVLRIYVSQELIG